MRLNVFLSIISPLPNEKFLRIHSPDSCLDIKDNLQWFVNMGPVAYFTEQVVHAMGNPLSPTPSPGTVYLEIHINIGQKVVFLVTHRFADLIISDTFMKTLSVGKDRRCGCRKPFSGEQANQFLGQISQKNRERSGRHR